MEKMRVLSYPPKHDYVSRLEPTIRLTFSNEPFPKLTNFYNPAWIRHQINRYDVAHFHFTWEQYSVSEFEQVLKAHKDNGKPIVWTAHDLRIPHTSEGQTDVPYMELLAEHADIVITLTDGAREELKERFSREAVVIPHGPILSKQKIERYRKDYVQGLKYRANSDIILLFHAKHLRANIDWRDTINTVIEAWQDGLPFRMKVLVYRDIPEYKEIASFDSNVVEVVPIQRNFSLDSLCEEMASADALLLPYLWGTHSGLVELAADIGMPVVSTDAGYWDEQYKMCTFHVEDNEIDQESLISLLRSFLPNCQPKVKSVRDRMKELGDFREAHRKIYQTLIENGS